jgi:hypothetical protein
LAAKTTNQATSVVGEFLKVAAIRPLCIQGTLASGASGGGASTVTFQDQIPTVPGLLVMLEYQISFSVTLTLTTAGNSAQVSPCAPHSAWSNQLTLGGAPPWPLTEFTPWWLDEITNRTNWDPIYPGMGNDAYPAGANLDTGVSGKYYSVTPGTVHTAPATPSTFTDTFVFVERIQLQQKRGLLYGAIPMGDPENKIRNVTQLNPLVGINPEQSLYVNASAGATAVLNGAATINCIYHIRYIDLLPSSDTNIPLPAIGYGLQLNANSSAIQNAGQQNKYYHRDSMVFVKILTYLVNAQLGIRAQYWGLWDTQEQKSARWEYDVAQNTFQTYFEDFQSVYRRYPLLGLYVADLINPPCPPQANPNVPSVTPYNGVMSPDANYAEAMDVAVTPAMTTTVTVPIGTTMNGAYQRVYTKGLVGVAY